jgi:hypothetical protein
MKISEPLGRPPLSIRSRPATPVLRRSIRPVPRAC